MPKKRKNKSKMKPGLQRRSLKKNKKRIKKTKRKKRTHRHPINKRMKGGSMQAPQSPPIGRCFKKNENKLGWGKRYFKIEEQALKFYDDNTKMERDVVRDDSILNLKDAKVSEGKQNRYARGTHTLTIIVGNRTVRLAFDEGTFDHDLERVRSGLVIMRNLKTAIENISEGREWDVSEEEETRVKEEFRVKEEARVQEEARRVKEEARVKKKPEQWAEEALQAKRQKEEDEIAEATKEFAIVGDAPGNKYENTLKRFIKFLNELQLPVNIISINDFNRGSNGLIVVVTIQGGGVKVLKISLETRRGEEQPCYADKQEYHILEQVNAIQDDITTGVDSFTCVTDIRCIVGFKMLFWALRIFAPDSEQMQIPGRWHSLLQQHPRNLAFSIVVMDYVEGVTLDKFYSSTQTDESKETFEDLRNKINLLHGRGIYHCDLHNGNVIVQKSDNSVRIIDFGKAKTIERLHRSGGKSTEWDESNICAPTITGGPQELVQENCPEPWNETADPCG